MYKKTLKDDRIVTDESTREEGKTGVEAIVEAIVEIGQHKWSTRIQVKGQKHTNVFLKGLQCLSEEKRA